MSLFHIAGLGEILWDVFPDKQRLGGAPLNFACACAELSREKILSQIVSAVGDDEPGRQALEAIDSHSVDTWLIQTQNRPTGSVQVSFDARKIPSYEFVSDCAWDRIEWNGFIETAAKKWDAVCFGTLGQRGEISCNTIIQTVESTRQECLRVFDINLRPPFYNEAMIRRSLPLCNVLKLNEGELARLAGLFQLQGNVESQLRQLARMYSLKVVALTLGADGSMILQSEHLSHIPGSPIEVVDTVGAGDAFTAALVIGLLQGQSLAEVHQHAADISTYVCTQNGATPNIPSELRF